MSNENSSDKLRLELLCRICRCGKPKKAGHTFCTEDYFKLPGMLSVRLYRKMGAGYEQAYQAAADWLDGHPGISPEQGPDDAKADTIGHPHQAEQPRLYEIPIGTGLSHCRGCRGGIYWIRTPRGKNMPVNQDGTSHFTTCPNAAKFSGKGKKKPQEQTT